MYFANFIFVIHLSVLFSPCLKISAVNNFNGHGTRGQQHGLNAVFNDTEHGRVLNDESSTCVYIAFGEAFSLMSLMGHLRYVKFT